MTVVDPQSPASILKMVDSDAQASCETPFFATECNTPLDFLGIELIENGTVGEAWIRTGAHEVSVQSRTNTTASQFAKPWSDRWGTLLSLGAALAVRSVNGVDSRCLRPTY